MAIRLGGRGACLPRRSPTTYARAASAWRKRTWAEDSLGEKLRKGACQKGAPLPQGGPFACQASQASRGAIVIVTGVGRVKRVRQEAVIVSSVPSAPVVCPSRLAPLLVSGSQISSLFSPLIQLTRASNRLSPLASMHPPCSVQVCRPGRPRLSGGIDGERPRSPLGRRVSHTLQKTRLQLDERARRSSDRPLGLIAHRLILIAHRSRHIARRRPAGSLEGAHHARSRSMVQLSGEGGIRTRGTLPYTRFPVVHLRPLGHLSDTTSTRPASLPDRRRLGERAERSEPPAFKRGGKQPSVAERAGFEPAVPLQVHLISNQAPSASRSPLRRRTWRSGAGWSSIS